MGDGADASLDRAFDDCEEYHRHKNSLSKSELCDLGMIDECGDVIGEPWSIPVSLHIKHKPHGPGPCPICGSETALRVNNYTGVEFYGCTRFPLCKGNRNR